MKPPSEDGCAVLLLCSDLMSRGADGEAKAYTVRQWANLSERLSGSDLAPGALFHVELKEIREKLGLADSEASRIGALLTRAGKLGVELAALHDKGISAVTSWDDGYPRILKTRLGKFAPPVLYYAGDLSLLSRRSVAIVGSREIDDAILKFTDRLSLRCVAGGLSIASGGARGVDSIAENAANRVEGNAIVVVADSLEKKIRQKDTRDAILRKKALILSAFRPDMPFQAFAAMERNKYIYALANYAVVVSSSYNKGGTWAGATENLKHGWVPMFVRSAEPVAEGNRRLLAEEGVRPITAEVLNDEAVNMAEWFASNVEAGTGAPKPGGRDEECRQQSLFDMLP